MKHRDFQYLQKPDFRKVSLARFNNYNLSVTVSLVVCVRETGLTQFFSLFLFPLPSERLGSEYTVSSFNFPKYSACDLWIN